MEVQMCLDILRRRWKLIAAATLIVAVVAGVSSSFKTPVYTASAQVLLRPGDPSEQITQTNQVSRNAAVADRYVAAQLSMVGSEMVARGAAQRVKGSTPQELLGQVQASQAGATDVVRISVSDPDRARAATIANAFADAYIENRKATAVASLEKAVREIDTKLSELENRIAELDTQIEGGLDADKTAADGLTRDQALSAARYLAAQQQTMLVNKTLKKGEAELITTAGVPTAPSSPKPKRDVALGAIVGLFFGLGIAFLREQLDDRVRGRADAEEMTKLPVIVELPFDVVQNPMEIAAHDRPHGALAEAARSLRSSLTFLGADEPLRKIVVTSAEPGDGRSFVAANLAAVYAQSGMRTILVSADLRRASLDTLFPTVVGGPGLAEVIAKFGAPAPALKPNGHSASIVTAPIDGILAKALRPTHIENLSLLPSGQLPPNPAEILGSAPARLLLDALAEIADVVIIDTPPVMAVTDAVVIARGGDGVVLVAAAEQTHKGALNRAASMLSNSHARLIGVALNKVEGKSGGSSCYSAYYDAETSAAKRSRLPWKRATKQLEKVMVGA